MLLNEVSLCKKLEHYLYWFTSGGLICKGWSNLLSRPFLPVFPDGHCAKLAVKYLIHGIEKQMTPHFKAYLLNLHIKKTKLEKKVILLQNQTLLRKNEENCWNSTQNVFNRSSYSLSTAKLSRVTLQEFIFLKLILNKVSLCKIWESWLY